MATLDIEKLRKVHRLMEHGATEGERTAARSRAESIAKAAGLTLDAALSKLDAKSEPQSRNIFEGFDDWMEAKEPGYKAREAAKRAERDARKARRRAEVMALHGSEAALFARTEREAALNAAVAPLATWDHWTGDDGTVHRYADTLDGKKPICGIWGWDDVTPSIREAVTGAYPWPATLADTLQEVKEWDRLSWDRGLFCRHGEWTHYAEVECRVALLERALECDRPAASWDDVQARFEWKRYQEERTWIDPTPRNDPFLDRLEADFAFLRQAAPTVQSGHGHMQPATRRTNAEKRTDVLSILDAHPELSDREIARRACVSPQTVNTWRRHRGKGSPSPAASHLQRKAQ